MSASKAALFASGIFFGGAIDHAILAAMRREVTPYGVKCGVSGNWLFAAADLLIAGVLYRVHATAESARLGRAPGFPAPTVSAR
jgi:hypothetical protein